MRVEQLNIQLPTDRFRGRFLFATALSGPTVAAIRFGEVIARKSLEASALEVTLITMLMPICSLAALWAGRMLEGTDQRPYVIGAGALGAAALMSGMFIGSVWHMVAIFMLFYLTWTVQLTAQNRILQQHVIPARTGVVFGLANGSREAVAAGASLIAGWHMDRVGDGYQHVFLISGVFALLAALAYGTIPTRVQDLQRRGETLRQRVGRPLKDVSRLLKRRPDFVRFQTAFMLYGIAFMSTMPVVPLFLVDDLKLDYTTIGFARGTLFQLMMIPSIWLFGRLFDRQGPHLMAARVFALLAGFPLLLILAWAIPPLRMPAMYTAFVLFGIAVGGVSVLWNIASVRFAGEEDAGLYQAVHVAFTGIRGSFAPLLAYLVMNAFGKPVALAMASALWILASGMMLVLHRKEGAALVPKRLERIRSAG